MSRVFPENEYDVVADILYSSSNQSLADIEAHVAALDQTARKEIFDSYFGTRLNRRHKPGRALENIHYTFDIVCDYGIFRDLQRHRLVNDLRWQLLTPGLGYGVPELVKQAGLEAEFVGVFDVSCTLYELLLAQTDAETAQ